MCIRCRKETKNFPKPSNRMTCGPCLHDLHVMHLTAELRRIPRGV